MKPGACERVAEPSRKVRWRRRTECVEDPLILSLNNSAPAPTSPLHLLHQTNSRSSSGLMSTYTCRSTSRVCRWQRGATSIYCIISCLLSCIKHCWNLITQTAEWGRRDVISGSRSETLPSACRSLNCLFWVKCDVKVTTSLFITSEWDPETRLH